MNNNNRLHNLIACLSNLLTAEDLRSAQEYLDAGEYGEALYLIVTQLFEYDVPVPLDVYRQIDEIGMEMGVCADQWKILLGQIADPDRSG